MVSWAVELGEFDIQVRPRPAIKSQVLADFIVEFTPPATEPAVMEKTKAPTGQTAHEDMGLGPPEQSGEIHWTLHVDSSAGKAGRGAGVILHAPDLFTAEYALRLDFKASNNEADYEALLAGLSLATELGAGKLKVYSDSQLVVEQVNGAYEAKGLRMKRYLQKVKEKLKRMGEVEILQVPRGMNNRADALSKMASEETPDFGTVLTEILLHPSINEVQVLEIPPGPNWMDPIMRYQKDGILLEDKLEARRLTAKAAHYVLHGPRLYKRSYTWPYLRCLVPSDSEYALREANGQVEVTNRILLKSLKKQLGEAGKCWVEALPSVLWAYRTTPQEIGLSSFRTENYDEHGNSELLRNALDLVLEKKEQALLRTASYQQKVAQYYNARVKKRTVKPGDLVLRRVEVSDPRSSGKLAPKWEGPYRVVQALRPGAYQLEHLDGAPVPRSWNMDNLRKFYQ
ncbi:uncharacterized protein LOC143858820 [Tasmannia lanceolata]|uniref:uncharacterized protein LOC143858820 n=1 Tax=Tasmannia lanceolata TaxID=3420 RepID=UPI004062C2A4